MRVAAARVCHRRCCRVDRGRGIDQCVTAAEQRIKLTASAADFHEELDLGRVKHSDADEAGGHSQQLRQRHFDFQYRVGAAVRKHNKIERAARA